MKFSSSKTRFPISSLGLQKVSPGEIRVERLEGRLDPAVPFPHRHDFFQLCLITEGKGWHEIDFNRFAVKPGQVFTMKPGQVHAWSFLKGTKGYLIEFTYESFQSSSDFAQNVLQILLSSPDMILLGAKKYERIWQVARLMLEDFKSKDRFYQSTLLSLLECLIFCLARDFSVSTVKKTQLDVAVSFRQLVEENYRHHHRVEFYAEALGLTPKALTMKLSRLLKRSPRSFIQDRLLLEAKRLLLLSSKGVAEIAMELGVEDANYFSRLFRSKMNCTPSEFREKVRA